jgi:uncharacterized damage-inducible protein DinB
MCSELENYAQRIADLRGQVRSVVVDLPVEALNWRPFEGVEEHATNSLAVLASHIAGAEHFWVGEVVGGRPPTRDRDAEFATKASEAGTLVQRLDAVGAETDEIFAGLKASDLDGLREARGRTMSVRWCILHIIDHTALHLGHMQLTYQLWRGGESGYSARWFERLEPVD